LSRLCGGVWRKATVLSVCLIAALFSGMSALYGQTSTGSIQGSVVDQAGKAIKGAGVAVTGLAVLHQRTAFTGADGKFTVDNLPPGTYSVQVSATGFAVQTQNNVTLSAGSAAHLSFSMPIASVGQEVTVEAEANNSLAARLAPMKSLIDAASPRTEITSEYVSQYTSPISDFTNILAASPGTVSWSTNGVGLGQATSYFRGFVDDDYTMTWDGVPFNDSNDPSHHSWAYVPGPAIGYVDFDRSPGTAADMGPANYGGSIHFFSPALPPTGSMRISESYGSFNTNQILGEYDSGLFGPGNKANFWFEGHHLTSDGYQTYNYQERTAGTAKFTWKFSDQSNLSVVGTVVVVDANTPNNDPYRYQIQQYGDNFYMQNNYYNADGTINGLYYKFYLNHIPTNFEVVTYTRTWGKGWRFELKPYTYSYSNHQHYNNDQYSDATDDAGAFGNTAPVGPYTGIDKMNQYVKGGVIPDLSYASRYGVARTGGWFEYTSTDRYQIDTNPTDWVDSNLIGKIKFHEGFITRDFQPFAEYQLVAIPRFTITGGVKDAKYNMTVHQWASNKDVGPLGCPKTDTTAQCPASVIHEKSYNSVLPSAEVNYRVLNDWSVYGDYGKGSIIPFSTVFDEAGAEVQVAPPPTVASTYQGGTVLKLNRLSMDADAYHIHFINQYSSYTYTSGPNNGLTYYYATPPSDTNGFEAEGNIAVGSGFSLYLNGTVGEAKYEAAPAQPATVANGETATPATPSAWVAETPHDTETISPTWQAHGWDIGFFNKRVGSRWEDDGSTHQNVPLDPWWMSNLFFNYSIRNGSRFDSSKIRLSFNNLFDNHNIADITGEGNSTAANDVLYTPSTLDTLELLPGRSVMVTFQLGLPHGER